METSIVGVGVSVSDRFRTVAEEKSVRIENLAPRAQRLDVKVTHRAYHNGSREDETVELTVTGKGPVVRAEATDGDKFVALDLAVDKLAEQLRRAKDKRVDARNHPRGAKLDKGSGSLAGIDLQPASVDVLRAVATGEVPVVGESDADEEYTPVVTVMSAGGSVGVRPSQVRVGSHFDVQRRRQHQAIEAFTTVTI